MAQQSALDKLYMDIAIRISHMSCATRAKVGALIVKDDNIISMGWNGTPAGDDNACEYADHAPAALSISDELLETNYPFTDAAGSRYRMLTKPEVLHAESNALMKLVARGGVSSEGSTLYVTLSPCRECAKLIKQARISRVVYRDNYRDLGGLKFLEDRGVIIHQVN
jgi:dCMP deaminase